MCELNKLDCMLNITDTQIIELFGQRQLVKWCIYSLLKQERNQWGSRGQDPPFLLTPIFRQNFPFHHTPDVTIWSSKFQKIPREGSLSPLSWPLSRFFSGFALDLGSVLKSQALRAPDSGFARISPNFWSVIAPSCSRIHMPCKLRLS